MARPRRDAPSSLRGACSAASGGATDLPQGDPVHGLLRHGRGCRRDLPTVSSPLPDFHGDWALAGRGERCVPGPSMSGHAVNAGRLLLHPTPTRSCTGARSRRNPRVESRADWGMRNPYSEGATQLGVFAALWCIGRAYQTGGMRWGVLGGASLGLCFLVRDRLAATACQHRSGSCGAARERVAAAAMGDTRLPAASHRSRRVGSRARLDVLARIRSGPGQCIGAAVGLDACSGGAVGCCLWSTTAHATDRALGARSGHTPLGCRRHNALRGLLRRDVGPTPHRAIPDQPQFGRPNLLRGNARADGLVCLDAGAGPCSRRGTDQYCGDG